MNKEDKEILLKDLSARLPYNVIINCTEEDDEKTNFDCFLSPDMIKDIKSETAYWIIKPYLRSMSSMTKEEYEEYYNISYGINNIGSKYKYYDLCDWFNKHHFDYRELIEKGLALEAPKGMYNIKEK